MGKPFQPPSLGFGNLPAKPQVKDSKTLPYTAANRVEFLQQGAMSHANADSPNIEHSETLTSEAYNVLTPVTSSKQNVSDSIHRSLGNSDGILRIYYSVEKPGI